MGTAVVELDGAAGGFSRSGARGSSSTRTTRSASGTCAGTSSSRRALVERCPDASVLLATSVEHADSLGVPDGVDLMRLPALRKVGNGHYTPRRLTIPAPT